MGFSGIAAAAIEMILLSPLQHRFGSPSLYKWTMALYPLVFLAFHFMNWVARKTMEVPGSPSPLLTWNIGEGVEHPERPPASVAVWVALAFHLTLQRAAALGYPCVLLSPMLALYLS